VQSKKRIKKNSHKNINLITKKNKFNMFNFKKTLNDKKSIVIFLTKFFGIFIVLELLINTINLTFLTNTITFLVASFFNLPYINNTIFMNTSSFVVTNSCTGLVSWAILCAITLPLKQMKLKKRVLILAIGAIFLLTLNIPRIGLVIYTGLLGFNAELVHEFTWFLMSAIILLVWYYGIKLIQKEKDFSKLI